MAAEAWENRHEERGLRKKRERKKQRDRERENLIQCWTNTFLSIERSGFSERNSIMDYEFTAH